MVKKSRKNSGNLRWFGRKPCISDLGSSERVLIPCITLPDAAFFQLNEHPKSSISPERSGSRAGSSIAMAAIALDPHQLVRSDSKITPRARSFRERVRGALLCVSDACARDALRASPRHFCLTTMPSAIVDKVISQDQVGSDASAAFVFAPNASDR